LVPGVIYGEGKIPVPVSVGEKELSAVCYTASFLGYVIETKIGSSIERLLPKEVVFHPVTEKPLHIDFQRISKDSKVKIGIAIEFVNEDKCPGIKKGGVINVVVHKLNCFCSPLAIPEKIIVDMTGKEVGDSFLLESIKLPDGVVAVSPEKDSILATLVAARTAQADDDSKAVEATEDNKEKSEEASS
jgi:large subunit ribosomal protein L25